MADKLVIDDSVRMWEEEALFARDVDGQLVRFEQATESDYQRDVSLSIDGQTVVVKKAVPLTDAQGNIVNDAEGRTIPRFTTILDAANEVYRDLKREADRPPPIPTLCHQEHLKPSGVCRVCSVGLGREKPDGTIEMGKLVPACVHPVQEGMIAMTSRAPTPAIAEEVRKSVRVLLELLTADHLPLGSSLTTAAIPNELATLARQFGVTRSRFEPRQLDRGQDDSSPVIGVDHNECILCDRCVRSCTDVKQNFVIGRVGKGYTTHIGFDLNAPMGYSTCVSCGECAINCPTGALSFQPQHIQQRIAESQQTEQLPGRVVLAPEEIKRIDIFSDIPTKFLQFNSGAVALRHLAAGEVMCREGEYGATAFLLQRGRFEVSVSNPAASVQNKRATGVWGWLRGGIESTLTAAAETPSRVVAELTPEDLIVGEMACLSNYPRSATVTALEDSEVIEIRRNVLYMLQRNKKSREILNAAYQNNALENQLNRLKIFEGLDLDTKRQCVEMLRDRVELVRVDPGQMIFLQGERADHFYFIRQGFVKVEQSRRGQTRVLRYLGPNSYFGEIGLLSTYSEKLQEHLSEELRQSTSEEALRQLVETLRRPEWRDRLPENVRDLIGKEIVNQSAEDLIAQLPPELRERLPNRFTGVRTSTCSALDDVELVRIRQEDFQRMIESFPAVREFLTDYAVSLLKQNEREVEELGVPLGDFLEQGLSNAQRLLVLDLECCTRCDECTRACADTHLDANGQGVTRLIREGLRFDKYLVASSCRSCLDPYCMVGCPVDAIHRSETLEIKIQDNCIGCGQCANNCPYGNINMHGLLDKTSGVTHQKATTCDLCRNVVGPGQEVSCVYACPHEAAFRMSGQELLERVKLRQ